MWKCGERNKKKWKKKQIKMKDVLMFQKEEKTLK